MIKIENVITPSAELWMATIMGARNAMNSWDKSDSEIKYENMRDSSGYIHIGPNDHSLTTKLRNAGTDHRKFMRYLDVCVNITAPLYWWKEFKTYRHGRKFMDDEDFFDYDDDEIIEMHVETNSCSTMHKIHDKEFTLDDFSCENLLSFRSEGNEWDIPNVDLSPDLDGTNIFSPHGVLNSILIPILNDCRGRFLETKDKKYWWQMIQLLPNSYNQMRTVKLNYEVLARMYKSRKNHKLDEWREFCKWIEQLPYSELITGGKDNE